MKKTFVHPYHNTQTTLNVTDGQNLSGGQQAKLEKELCGMDDCCCNFYPVNSTDGHWNIRQDGSVHADEVSKAAAALGRRTSPAKTKAARENGKEGGWPKGRKRKPATDD